MRAIVCAEEEASLGEVLKEELFPGRSGSLFGIPVNPSFVTAFWLSVALIVLSLIFRFLIYPRFKTTGVPGKFQCLMEKAVEAVENFMKEKSPHSTTWIGMLSFTACLYIGFGTMCEVLGIRAILVDINACIALALVGYGTMLAGGFYGNKAKGALGVLKDVTMLLSMSFRLFGAMIGGLIMTGLVYYYVFLMWGVPIVVAVLFSALHAIIQSYVYMTLVGMFYGEAVEPRFLDGSTSSEIKRKNKRKEGI